ncbi:hypothetical protein LTR28_013958 [Elasticomyces elasticus]|nr:hypothetical protein LTR28_013958 [Elasticomyces elasticus]
MSGGITRDLGKMLTNLQGRDCSLKSKYDGHQAQVHCDEHSKVTIFSRHLEVMTDKYLDLVALVPKIRAKGVESLIIEGEVIAINRTVKTEVKSIDATSADSGAVSEFFKSATDVRCEGIKVKVLDNLPNPDLPPDDVDADRVLLPPSTPQKRKGAAAAKAKKKSSANDVVVNSKSSTHRKALLATYEPDKRLDFWLEVKKHYNTSADTIDLISVGAWHGISRKCKWWSPILLAVRNSGTGYLEAVTKCISGFSDKFYATNRAKYDPDDGGGTNVNSKPSYIEYGGRPSVWFEPQEVWECALADITLSPTYMAALGLVREERGLSLRFLGFSRVREDKGNEEAGTSDFLAELYGKQQARALQKGEEKIRDAEKEEW